jgi:hypothetical protein
MNGVKRFATACAALVLMTTIGVPVAAVDGTAPETMTKVRRALERLPYYGVYDFLAFGIENGVVTLRGYAHRPALKREAEEMVRRATGADIANRIEILPASTFDDRIRWATYKTVYTDEIADRDTRCWTWRAFPAWSRTVTIRFTSSSRTAAWR